ncbi:MAG: hypothetical protein R6X02_35540 [Enhygromyxa sp.]
MPARERDAGLEQQLGHLGRVVVGEAQRLLTLDLALVRPDDQRKAPGIRLGRRDRPREGPSNAQREGGSEPGST